MEWIDRLNKDGWNFIIDELVWHLQHGRVPTQIAVRFEPVAGVEYSFRNATPAFHPIFEEHLQEHWSTAVEIIGKFPELSSVVLSD